MQVCSLCRRYEDEVIFCTEAGYPLLSESLEFEPEEITLVRAPRKPIMVRWDGPAIPYKLFRGDGLPSSRQMEESSFFPTILGSERKTFTIDPEPTDSMFSTYYPSQPTHSSVPYRSLMIGGVAALTVLFLFGDDIVRSYSSTEVRSGSEAAIPVQRAAVTPSKQRAFKSVGKLVAQNQMSKTEKTRAARTTELKNELENSTDKKIHSEATKSTTPTRPRIVKR